MFEIICGLIFLMIPLLILAGAMKGKYRDMVNPVQKDNSDYRFIEVKNIKTRKIFKETK